MPTIQELNEKVSGLQSAVDSKQEQIGTAVAGYKTKIEELQALVDAGAGGIKPEELQTAIDGIQTITDDLAATPTE